MSPGNEIACQEDMSQSGAEKTDASPLSGSQSLKRQLWQFSDRLCMELKDVSFMLFLLGIGLTSASGNVFVSRFFYRSDEQSGNTPGAAALPQAFESAAKRSYL